MFHSRELHRHGYCLLGSLTDNLFVSFCHFEPCNHLPKCCLIDYYWLLLFLFSMRRPDLTDIILLIYQIEIQTTPADFRFPTTNQTRHCFTRYVEFHRYM